MTNLISVNKLTVKKQGQIILDNISIAVSKNEFITIIGPNGAGKSTLLKCMMGLQKPSQGQVKRHQDLTIGYVPQHFNVSHIMPISVYDFIGINKTNTNQIDVVANETGSQGYLNKQLHVISAGELQSILLCRALLDKPNLLILDEPAQSLDLSGQLRFYKMIQEIQRKRNLSVVIVSHDLHMVMACTQKVICLFRHICCSGEPEIVSQDPEFISMFGKDMSKVIAYYHHIHDHDHA